MNELFNKIAQLAAEVSAFESKVKTDNATKSSNGRETIRAYMEKLLHCIAPIKAAEVREYEICEFVTHNVQFRFSETSIECVLYSGEKKDGKMFRPVGIAFSYDVRTRRLSNHGGFSADSFSNDDVLKNMDLIEKFASIPVDVIDKHVAEWCMDRLNVRMQIANATMR